MTQQHQTQRVLITAAASGIGQAIAEAFLAQEAQVYICDISLEHLAGCKATLPGLGVTQTDVSDPEQIEQLFQDVESSMGGFDVLVNNVCPGSVEGPRMDRVIVAEAKAQGVSEESVRDGYIRQTSLRTLIRASDIANLALFLCSEAGNKISGQALGDEN